MISQYLGISFCHSFISELCKYERHGVDKTFNSKGVLPPGLIEAVCWPTVWGTRPGSEQPLLVIIYDSQALAELCQAHLN